MEIYLSVVSGFKARNYAQMYLHHSDFSSLFQTLWLVMAVEERLSEELSAITIDKKSLWRWYICEKFQASGPKKEWCNYNYVV